MSWADCEAELAGLTERGSSPDDPALQRAGELAKRRAQERRYRETHPEQVRAKSRAYKKRRRERERRA